MSFTPASGKGEGPIYLEVTKTGDRLRRILVWLALALAGLGLFALATVPEGLTYYYLYQQDVYVLAGLVGLLVVVGARPRGIGFPKIETRLRLTTPVVAGIATVLALVLWAGTYLVFDNHPLARDEQMVLFDMAVFRSGHLAAPLTAEWRPYLLALIPEFLLRLPGNAAWVSSYMPGNAMLRTAFGAVLDPALMNPMLTGVGAVALFDIARRLFPDHRGAQGVALLLYATSAQVLATAMTPFAMTPHLALNLVWLACYMRGTRGGHAAAIGLGFIGIGLHQVIFHPLFALPFIERLRRNGQSGAAVIYVVSYAAFGLFWISYPQLVALSAGIQEGAAASVGMSGFIADRVLPVLVHRDPQTLPLMAANLIRFATWQNLALVPLMALGFQAFRRDEGMARPLAYGILVTTGAMAILLPYQGHGWGYRYLHGLIGSCALLGAYGWRDCPERPRLFYLLGAGTIATLCWSLPFLLWQTHRFVQPYANVDKMIAATSADMVVVETDGLGFPLDLVHNDPWLKGRPIRLASSMLGTADIDRLCRRGSMTFVDVTRIHALGVGSDDDSVSRHFKSLRDAANAAGCLPGVTPHR